jgi:hypothetical protein
LSGLFFNIKSRHISLVILLLSIAASLISLYIYDGRRIQADDFALGKENTSRTESWNGVPFTGHIIADIAAIVRQYANSDLKNQKIIAWFGNSQLHTLNQYKHGEHLAPYWLRKLAPCPDCIVPLGLSQSNVNPQEEFVLSQYVAKRVPLSAIVLQVEFMGFREDGLRGEYSIIASADLVNALHSYPIGKDLAILANGGTNKDNDNQEKSGLDSYVQLNAENYLSRRLGEIWPLWKDRVNLRTTLLGDLFTFRNWALNIRSTSVRKIIRPRYQRNMRALEDLLACSRVANIPVVVYFAPVRQDKPLPYDRTEYAQWKEQVELLAKTYSASLINLEKLVPPQNWGSNFGADIDFMHFQEPGHKMVAAALYPLIHEKIR